MRRFSAFGLVLALIVAFVLGSSASSEPIDGIRVPGVEAFNALDARVSDLEQRVDALEAPPEPDPTEEPTPTPDPDPTEEPTPTPDPTATMKGWELVPSGSGANVGLAAHGLTCASLPTYTGPAAIPAGTSIAGKRFLTRIDVSAGDITIEKSCFQGDTPASANDGLVEGYYPQGDITIKDSEFDGSRLTPEHRDSACGFAGGANLIRNYVHDLGSGLCQVSSSNVREENKAGVNVTPKNLRIVNNYVHQHTSCCGAHHEAATVRDFIQDAEDSRTMKWIGNWLDITQTEYVSGGLFLQATFEPIHNLWLEDNVFAGEGHNLVIDQRIGNLHVINNRFKPGTREYYGPVAGRGGAVEWSENYMFDASQPGARGAIVN